MRSISQVSLAAVAAATCFVVAAPAQAQEQQHRFNVAAQPASSGVVVFAQQAGIQILAPGDATAGKRVSSVRGDYTVREGLHRLLARTGLRVASFDGRTAVLTADPTGSRTTAVAPSAATTTPAADAQAAATASSAASGAAGDDTSMQEIVVTGSTSGKRTLFDESSDVTLASAADIQRKAPRSTAEALELVPGIFVEGTAGAVSNNYSVRGLRGGAQTFIQLEEDGLPIIYGGGGADEYFQNDITIDRLESVEGGTSGILAVNGAAATINFISIKPSFDHVTSMVRFTGTSYGEGRADAYFSAPIADNLAFNVGGYVTSNPGFRSSSFDYRTYHIKGMLEYRFGGGGYARLTLKSGNQHDAYYADMPFTSDGNGHIGDVPGLNGSRDNIAGRAFANIGQPDSCFTGTCVRNFSLNEGIHTTTTQYRGDIEAPLGDSVKLFAHARYLRATFDFNGIFPGSNGQPPASAVTYLTPGVSPISSLLAAGLVAFPGTARFGIRNTLSGVVTPSSDAATLNALNGNGLLQETVLNHQTTKTRDFGSNFGVTWDTTGSTVENSLTVGGMYYNVRRRDNQSAVSTVINDVTNNSAIYDVVALDASNNVLGQLTNNGQISYGNWGQGIFHDHIDSLSGYFNDELKIGEKLHIDFGLRYEHQHDAVDFGNSASPNGTVQPGTPGIVTDLGATFDGTYTHKEASYNHLAWTAGVNYALSDHLAFYARYARGFQTNGGNSGGAASKPSNLTLYEAGARLQNGFIAGSLVAFRTEFRNQFYTFTNPNDPSIQNTAQADDNINGVQLDVDLNPTDFFTLSVSGVYQDPKLVNLRFNGAPQPGFDGNTPERTPKELLTVTPAFILPGGLGEIYGRYKYIGKIFADAGNGVALPAYGVFTIGAMINLSDRINLNVSIDNLTNVDGYTEGNPRQGQTQSIVNGYFYGRSIVGRNALASVTFKF